MYQEKRLKEILNLLQEKKELSTHEMVEHFGVSRDTIRRDFLILSQKRKVTRTHGGIVILSDQEDIPSFSERLIELDGSKEAIALLALKLIHEQGTYFFDVSTILLKLSQLIDLKTTIFSHSLDNAIVFSEKDIVNFHLFGGKFYSKNRFYYSLAGTELMTNLSFDAAFISAGAVHEDGIYFEDQEDALVKKYALEHSKTRVLLAEAAKFEKKSVYKTADLDKFDYFITDQALTEQQKSLFPSRTTILYPEVKKDE